MSQIYHRLKATLDAATAQVPVSIKLSVAFAAVLLLGVLGMGTFAHLRARQQAVRGELATLALLSERLAGQVDAYLSTTRDLARHLALTQDVARFLATPPGQRRAETLNHWLDLQAMGGSGPSALFVMDPEGTCVASSARNFLGENFGFRPYFQEAMAGRAYSSDWFLGRVTRTPKLFSSAPVILGGRVVGVLVAQYEVQELEAAIQSFGQSRRTAVLINHLGISLAHSQATNVHHVLAPLPAAVMKDLEQSQQFLGQPLLVDPLSAEFVAAFRQVLQDGHPRTAQYRLGDQPKWGVLSRVRGQPWVVSVSVPEADLLTPAKAVWRETLTVGFLTACGAFLFALGLVRLLLRPLRTLSMAITAFGQGDPTARAPLQTHRELDQLALTFNTMANTIQNHRENLEALVLQRTQDLEKALADMKQLHGMIPICSYCKKIRDDGGSWWQLESYIQKHSEAEFSHGICPDCRTRHFPTLGPSGS
ncbi:MAG: Signal transduction histidine kinase regulating C4-dicarboxylate transport system [Holophagaceae bacterium]|nr:Signal transduction histidine kinase regulating C4-dicarboxylate transport system [Holophagaceae bacterium]